jgi:isocitrate dehydrogenase
MSKYAKITPPTRGSRITGTAPNLKVPDDPIIPFIRGDGTGPDIWAASQRVFDAAVNMAFGGKKRVEWFEIYAGDLANSFYGEVVWLPEDTLRAIEEFKVAIKGPLTTPVGEGHRSINVTLRQRLDLYACVRPVRWFEGVPAPVKSPGKLNVVIFRENTEDVYAGIEWKAGTKEAQKVAAFLRDEMKKPIPEESGIGIKPISKKGSQRLVRMAIQHAIANARTCVTIVHKGNIMKFTEGAFRDWGYEVAKTEFRDQVVTEQELWDDLGGKLPAGKILVNDRIADSMFQQVLLRPEDYQVIATPNLNGDYLSDACAAQVGGLGLAPGANIGDVAALFEATHGTAPKHAGLDKINPGSVILSGVMMFEYMGWKPVCDLIVRGLERTIRDKTVTYDLERQMEGAKLLKCSEFGTAIVKNMDLRT